MRVLFDPDFDLGSWPGPREQADAVAGAAWLGPQGFLALLETQLGLDVPHASMADRTAALVPRIFRADRFYGHSAKAAPWSAAKRLLEWRDHLWEYGWRGEGLGQRRLGELAEVTLDLQPGRAERLEAVAGWLACRSADVAVVRLLVARASLSPAWRSVLDALEGRGTCVMEVVVSPAPAIGNLLAVRGASASVAPLDSSLQLVRPHGPQEAARDLAEALAADPALGDTVFIGGDGVLDEALAELSLPTLGAASAYAGSALAAVLPLTLALAWSPIDPRLALEWLMLPDSLLPRGIARQLAEALGAWPAVGNPRWCQVADDATRGAGGAEVRAILDTVFVPIASRDRTVRVRDLVPRIEQVARWAEQRAGTSLAHGEVFRQARGLRRRFQIAELHRLTPPQVDAVVASVVGDGSAARRTAHWGHARVGLPGGVAGPARRVIWWNFLDDGSLRRARVLLRADERRALEFIGVNLPSIGDEANAAAARARRPLDQTAAELILVAPRHDEAGEPTHPHPLWEDIASQLRDPRDARHLVAERPRLSRPPRRATVAVTFAEPPQRVRRALVGVTVRPAESPTSLAKLLGCSFAYALEYVGRLRPRSASRVVTGSQLYGRLAHEVLATVARSGSLEEAGPERRASEALERMLPTHAAELLLPGHDQDLALVRESLAGVAALLGRVVREEGLRVHATEHELSVELEGRTLRGTPDLVLEVLIQIPQVPRRRPVVLRLIPGRPPEREPQPPTPARRPQLVEQLAERRRRGPEPPQRRMPLPEHLPPPGQERDGVEHVQQVIALPEEPEHPAELREPVRGAGPGEAVGQVPPVLERAREDGAEHPARGHLVAEGVAVRLPGLAGAALRPVRGVRLPQGRLDARVGGPLLEVLGEAAVRLAHGADEGSGVGEGRQGGGHRAPRAL